jgi:hypothetical protein
MASSAVGLRFTMPRGGVTLTRQLIALPVLVIASAFIGLLTFFVGPADAGCPPPTGYRYIGGSCYFVKGVEIDAQVNHTGNLNKDPKTFSASIAIEGGTAILFCKNKAGHQPPGQKIVPVPVGTQLTCSTGVNNVVSNQNGGTANVVCTALLVGQDLSAFDAFCTTGQVAADLVPIQFLSDVTYDATTGHIESAQHQCTLPSPETLAWDRATDKPERRAYDCIGPLP